MADRISEFAASRIDLSSDLDFGPIDPSLINAAEVKLAVKLPDQYRDYLANYAGGLLLGWELYGIPAERSNYPSELAISGSPIIDLVEQNRRMQNPIGTIEFTNDGGGFFFAFIPEIDANAVFVRGYGADWSQQFSSLHDMLARIVDNTISY